MKIEFRESFAKDLRKIGERSVVRRIEQLVKVAEFVPGVAEIPGIKKLAGGGNYYRVRIGQYRVGIVISDNTAIFVRVLHRKDIYRYFP